MPFNLPPPGEAAGSWGAGMFPPWFDEEAAAHGWDALTAANQFLSYVESNPQGPDGNPVEFGWYWDSFKPGGVNAGQHFDMNSNNTTYPGQTVNNPPEHLQPPVAPPPPPPPGGTPPPPPPPPPGAQTPPGQAPKPTAPPQGQTDADGRWVPVIGQGGQKKWEWKKYPKTPPPPVPPAATVPPPVPPPPPPPPEPVSGPPIISYPPAAQQVAQPMQTQAHQPAAAQNAANSPMQPGANAPQQAYPLGGGPPSPSPDQGTARTAPGTQTGPPPGGGGTPGGGGGAGGGGGVSTGGPPPTLSGMNAQKWKRPGGLLG